jgi:hypothetical protein
LNMAELREALSDQIRKLQTDETTPGKANAVTNASGKILSSIKLEMEYFKQLGRPQTITFLELEHKSGDTAPIAVPEG